MSGKNEHRKSMVPNELRKKFRSARGQIRKISFIKGLSILTGCVLVSFIMAVVLDRLFRLDSPYRLAVLLSALGVFLYVTVRFLTVPLLRRYTAKRISISVEEVNPQLGDSLLTTVELAEEYDNGTLKTSPDLVRAHTEKTVESAHAIDFRTIAPFRALTKIIIFAIVAMAIVGVFCVFETPIAKNVFARMLSPFGGPEPFTYTKLSIEPGSIFIQKGDDVEVSALIEGKVPENGYIHWKTNSNKWEKIKLEQVSDRMEYKFTSLLTPVKYMFRAGDARSDTYIITPVTSPAVIGITPKIFLPEYTNTSPKTLRDSGGLITALKGSKVKITALTNKPCKYADIVWIDGAKVAMKIAGTTLESPELDIANGGTYHFQLEDEFGFTNTKPIYYRVETRQDEAPTVLIEKPSQYSEATPDAVVIIGYSILDDFGIERVWLDYTIYKKPGAEKEDILPEDIIKGSVEIHLIEKGAGSIHSEYNFLISELDLAAGYVVTFKLKAQDGDILSGPNTGGSEEIKIKIISDEDSYNKIEREQQDLQRRIKMLINQQKQNEDAVIDLSSILEKEGQLSKSDKRDLTSSKHTQQDIEQTDREIADDMDKVIANMQQNPMIGLRSVIQMNDIKKALEGLADREMAGASEEMSKAEKAPETKVKAEGLKNATDLQDEIIQKLEDIDAQFSKMQEDQRLASLANAARGLAKKQDKTTQETSTSRGQLSGMMPEEMSKKDKRRLKKLVDEQKKLTEKLEELEQRMHRTQKQMKYGDSDGSKNIEQAMQKMNDEKISEDMKKAEEQLSANHLNKAMKSQNKASKKLWDLVKALEKEKQDKFSSEFKNMEAKMREQVVEIDRLIELQQGILEQTVILPVGDEMDPFNDRHLVRFMEVSSSQAKLHERTEEFTSDLEAIFENIIMFDIDPIGPLKAATVAMEKATTLLEELRQASSIEEEKEVLKQLEKAREELAKALSKLIQEGKLQQMMQQMSIIDEMIEKQLKINKDTIEVDDKIKPEQEIPETLKRLSKKLARLQKELGETADSLKEQLKSMKEISELMQKVSKELEAIRTGKNTQSMQDEIIERLVRTLMQLQMQMASAAQASGMSTMGGAGGGGNHGGIQLPPRFVDRERGITDDEWAKLPERLKKQLLDAWSEDYPPRFRRLLNVYYRRLSSEENR